MKLPCMDAYRKSRLVIVLVAFLTTLAPACAGEVVFISHALLPPVNQLAQQTAAGSGLNVRVMTLEDSTADLSADAVVLVGAKALAEWQGPATVPQVAVFVSREAVAESKGLASAVYLEPPFKRQVALAQAILGIDRPLGVLVADRRQWQQIGDKHNPLLTPYFTDQYPTLNHALLDLLKNNQALIGIYDTGLYSSANIKNILITAYRQNKPLIGPSSAYIKAGALATTYSDIPDVARRLSEVLLTGLQEKVWPAADYNPYFKVKYNQQVGRSLNLLLPDADRLATELAEQEKRQ